jgi:FkbM family methyltransferase
MANMIKNLIENSLNFCLKSFQDYINSRFDLNEFINIDGNYYALNHSILSVGEVKDCYKFDDINSTDIVLDIGANIGGFAIPASRKGNKVYAFEPLFYEQLRENIIKNHIKNIEVFPGAIGDGELKLKYNEKSATVQGWSLSEILNLCEEHISFLKLDCEGGEHSITLNDMIYAVSCGLRRIEMEWHNFDGIHNIEKFCDILKVTGFEYELDYNCNKICVLIHARKVWNVDKIDVS